MASDGDVEMADAARSVAAPTTRDAIHCITTGKMDTLASFAPSASARDALEASGSDADADAERDLLAPFLPLLTRVHDARRGSHAMPSSASPFVSLLSRYDQVNELSEYTCAVQSLSLADVEGFAAESADATPVYRQFEGADARERACIVLHLVEAFAGGAQSKDALHENELVRNDIYKPHLVAILVNALAADALLASTSTESRAISLAKVVRFALAVPLGVDLIEAIVLNDPSSFAQVVDVVVQSIHKCNPLQASPPELATAASVSSTTSMLPYELRQAQAVCSALAAFSPTYAVQIAYRLRDDAASVAAAFVAFQLIVELPALRNGEDHFYASFVHQWLRLSATEKNPATSALHVFLQAALSREGDNDQEKAEANQASPAAVFLEETRYVMSQFRQFLIEDMVQFRLTPGEDPNAPNRFAFTMMLNVLIGFLLIGRLHPEDHETSQLLKLFDKVSKEIPQLKLPAKNFERLISLMYVLVLLLCSPSAPAFAKMPSQREDSTKLVLQLAQQCIYSLNSTKAASPLFILSSVLLYTKSPSLLPFLSSLLGDTFPLTVANVRVEHLYGVGDAILKPILTEHLMARDVLTTCEPPENLSARDRDAMEEMVLRSIHGLLSEKSFLRHHHARKLEEWITLLINRATTPVHPLVVSVLLEWIENYVMAFEYPISQRPLLQLAVIPLSPGFVSRTLGSSALTSALTPSSQREWAKAALVLTYSLQFNQRLRMASAMPGTKLSAFANQGGADGNDQPGVQPVRGSSDIVLSYELEGYPIKKILTQVSRFAELGGLFEFVVPTLRRLMTEEYPHMFVDGLVSPRLAGSLVRSRSRKHTLRLVSVDSSREELPRVSWNSVCMWLSDLHSAPLSEVEEGFHLCASALLPLAIMSVGNAINEDIGPDAFFAVFSDFYNTHARGERANPVHLDRQIVEALCIPQVVWRQYQQTETRKSLPSSAQASATTSAVWIQRSQLVENPFYVLQNAHTGVLASVPLLRLALGLVKSFREESIFHLRRRETIGVVAKKAAQANDAASNGTTAAPVSSSDPATQQFLIIQDCILVQSMLDLVTKLKTAGPRQEKDECVLILFRAIDELLTETKGSVSATTTGSSPPLALVIHCQGYDAALVASFVDQVASLKHLWMHWMHQPSAEVASSKNTSDRRGGSSSTPSHSGAKAIADFVSDSATEKDLIKWQFRVRVFFKLCEKYFAAPAHSTAAMQTIKQILNRLRGIAVSSSGSSKGVLHALSIGDNTARVAFVEAVLNDAIDGCAPHPELRSEITQFLLNLKKHVGSTASQGHAVASPSGVESGAARARDHHQDLERVVFRAYQKSIHFP